MFGLPTNAGVSWPVMPLPSPRVHCNQGPEAHAPFAQMPKGAVNFCTGALPSNDVAYISTVCSK